jgi:hypothetical protein
MRGENHEATAVVLFLFTIVLAVRQKVFLGDIDG